MQLHYLRGWAKSQMLDFRYKLAPKNGKVHKNMKKSEQVVVSKVYLIISIQPT